MVGLELVTVTIEVVNRLDLTGRVGAGVINTVSKYYSAQSIPMNFFDRHKYEAGKKTLLNRLPHLKQN